MILHGFVWATVIPRGNQKGIVRDVHRTYEAASRAAKGKDLDIVDVREAASY